MPLIPEFELGLRDVWILMLFGLLGGLAASSLINKKAMKKFGTVRIVLKKPSISLSHLIGSKHGTKSVSIGI